MITINKDKLKQYNLLLLDDQYQPQFLELSKAWLNATMNGNATLAEKRKTEKSTIEAEYYAKREVIENA